ncbi:MAG TPA: CsbD family protein [Lacipirellulaceae bacterium]|nr:CsbD family protein [Lacipirellulaceae bacterium]
MAINQQMLEGNWNEIKGKLHEKWGQLSNDDLSKAQGNVDQLVGVIQRKTGEARDRVEQFLNELTSGGASGVSKVAETVRSYASQAASHAAGSVEDMGSRATDYVRGGYVQTERMIQQRPMESLAAGFGAGLIAGVVIGLMLRR